MGEDLFNRSAMRNDRLVEILKLYPADIDVCVNAQVGDAYISELSVCKEPVVVCGEMPDGRPFAYQDATSVTRVAGPAPEVVDILVISF